MSVTLVWSNESGHELPESYIETLHAILNKTASSEGVDSGEVALTFVDDEEIRELNRAYRGIDKATDVLSFAMREQGEDEPEIHYSGEEWSEVADGEPLGDIIISLPRAQEQSEEYGHTLEREIGFLFIHGFLHLLGYDHQDAEAERDMFARQERMLNELGLTR